MSEKMESAQEFGLERWLNLNGCRYCYPTSVDGRGGKHGGTRQIEREVLRRDSKIGEGGCCDPSKLVQVRVEQCWSYLWKRIVDVAPGPDGPGDLRLGPGDVIELQPGRPAAMEL